ncbi:MAG TPA: hypothetical protein EYH24_04920 [Thermococcus paralvinellae]|uniref:Uncharacterized protein n=1 Tax=Thermococcus paralvinellae TaxID=582419 RepID=A0A832ZBS0_9EURY|nr:hypothetical protein [Thermococcus paralvinellae]HIP89273.1 hypothetical protein [Thermococcus paralvinellae]
MNSTIPRKEVDPIRELIPWARHDAILKAFDEKEKREKRNSGNGQKSPGCIFSSRKVKGIIGEKD